MKAFRVYGKGETGRGPLLATYDFKDLASAIACIGAKHPQANSIHQKIHGKAFHVVAIAQKGVMTRLDAFDID